MLSAATAKGEVKSGASGSAVRFACFLRIFLVASDVTYWNYGEDSVEGRVTAWHEAKMYLSQV